MTRRKLNSDINSTRFDDKYGKTIRGKFAGVSPMMTMDNQQVVGSFNQPLYTMELAEVDGAAKGELTKFWCDGGLRGALKLAKVEPGMEIEIVHTGEKKIEDGKVQTYDVFGF